MNNIAEESKVLNYMPSIEELEWWIGKFLGSFHEAYRRIMRKEIYYALHCIDNLRLLMTMAWYMNAGIQPNSFGDWAKLEGERSKLQDWQKSLLAEWQCSRDPKEIINVLKCVVPEFMKVHKNLCKQLGLEEKSEWVKDILEMVL